MSNSETYDSPDVLNILLGRGDGTFKEALAVATSAQFRGSVVPGDFNGDGIPDIAVTNNGDVEVSILLGQGDGTFKAALNVITDAESTGIATADFNHDGIADLAILTANEIQIFLGNGDGSFQSVAKAVPLSGLPIWIAVGDFNGDGNVDLAVTNNSSVSVFLGDGDGGFKSAPGAANEIPSAQGLAVGDFNGDGIPDLVAVNFDGNQDKAVAVMTGKGDGTFEAPKYYGAEGILNPLQPVVTDLNGDGIADLVVASAYSGSAPILLGKGDGTFTPAGTANAGFEGSGSIAVADFNGDGIPDLAVPNPNRDSTVSIVLTQPTQTVTATLTGLNPVGPGTQEVIASYSATAYSRRVFRPRSL